MNGNDKISVNEGAVFEGTRTQFANTFTKADVESIIEWCVKQNFTLDIENCTVLSRAEDEEDEEDVMTMEHFIECVECGGFTDDDGFGEYSNGKLVLDAYYSGSVDLHEPDMSWSHVVWHNK